jgi:hypothetical protein
LLYEPAFAIIASAFQSKYKIGITLITLVAGFASTVFIPLTHQLSIKFGWQHSLILLGTLEILINVPLHFFSLPTVTPQTHSPRTQSGMARLLAWAAELRKEAGNRRFLGLALWFSSHNAAFSGMTFLLIPIHQAQGVNMGPLLLALSLIGPMQVAGRIILAAYGGNFSTLRVGTLAMIILVSSLLVLMVQPPSLSSLIIFAVLYGGGNGIMTIVKGTAIAEFYGTGRYAELNGLLSAPTVLARAGAPCVLAALWAATGNSEVVLISVLLILIFGSCGIALSRSGP